MAVLINFKICDNAPECGGIEVCPTKALFWDGKKDKIGIDNDKCSNCKKCEEACPVFAIKIAKTAKEYEKFKKEVDEDPRRMSDLFVDRYGAMPIDPDALIKEEDFEKKVLNSGKLILVEFFKKDAIQCLKKSIPIRELIPGQDILFKKFEIGDNKLLKKFGIEKVPALCFFDKGKLIGKIEGYYDVQQKQELKEKLESLMKKKDRLSLS